MPDYILPDPCPDCGEVPVLLEKFWRWPMLVAAICESCGLTGPWAFDIRSAVFGWNCLVFNLRTVEATKCLFSTPGQGA